MHYYQHHIGDFLKDTGQLSNEQLGVYMRMLWVYYDTEKPFADSCDDIAFAVRSDEKTVHLLLRHFFVQHDDGWHQPRCDREIARFHNKAEKAKESANARWSNAKAMRTHTDSNASDTKSDANQEPITKNQEPEGFTQFWSVYPKKVAKPAALKAFRSAKINGHLPEVLADIESKNHSPDWQKNDGQFVPNPATYLNQRRWEDGKSEQPSGILAGAI